MRPRQTIWRRPICRLSPRTLLKGEWPYLLILVLALFGIAYTSFSRTPMTLYWIVLAPLIGIICVSSRDGRTLAIEGSAYAWCGHRHCIGQRCFWRCILCLSLTSQE